MLAAARPPLTPGLLFLSWWGVGSQASWVAASSPRREGLSTGSPKAEGACAPGATASRCFSGGGARAAQPLQSLPVAGGGGSVWGKLFHPGQPSGSFLPAQHCTHTDAPSVCVRLSEANERASTSMPCPRCVLRAPLPSSPASSWGFTCRSHALHHPVPPRTPACLSLVLSTPTTFLPSPRSRRAVWLSNETSVLVTRSPQRQHLNWTPFKTTWLPRTSVGSTLALGFPSLTREQAPREAGAE